jgi:predicted dehydrogenase
MRFENNVTVEIELGSYYLSDRKDWFERHWNINGNKGCMYVDKFEPVGKIVRTAHLLENVKDDQDKSTASYGPTRSFGIPEEGLIITEDIPNVKSNHSDYFRNYFRALDGEEEFLVTPSQIRRVLQVMEACRISSQTRRSFDFE